ncbi:MAG: cupin domain-containing protein [Gammaproteobacteria bacterium]
MNESDYRAHLAREGYGEPEELSRPAGLTNDEHSHDFSACALVLEGELSVVTADAETTCRAGDFFELAAGTPHYESYGPAGARFLLARRAG